MNTKCQQNTFSCYDVNLVDLTANSKDTNDNNNSIPNNWCNSAIHSNTPQEPGTLLILESTVKIPNIICINTIAIGKALTI